jgi:integrase
VREKNGAWYWEHYVEGKQKMTRLGSSAEIADKRAAVDAANAMHTESRAIVAKPESQGMTVREYAETVFLPWAERNKAASTYRQYRQNWANPLKEHFGEIRLAEYRTGMASRFLDSLALRGMGRNTINHVRAQMSVIFAHAAGEDLIAANPIHSAKMKETAKAPEETRHYTVVEMAGVLTALENNAQARAIMALSFAGLRRAEISGLRWEDIDLTAGTVNIKRSAWEGKVGRAKNGQSLRTVTAPLACAALAKLERDASGYVFANEVGGPLDLGLYAARRLRPMLDLAGVEWKGFHAGRRGAVTQMRQSGATPEQVARHFGHSVEVANKHYLKDVPTETRRAALELDAVLTIAVTDKQRTTIQ